MTDCDARRRQLPRRRLVRDRLQDGGLAGGEGRGGEGRPGDARARHEARDHRAGGLRRRGDAGQRVLGKSGDRATGVGAVGDRDVLRRHRAQVVNRHDDHLAALTLRGHQLISSSPVIAYLCNAKGESLARSIAVESIAENQRQDLEEIAVIMPMQKDRTEANRRYDEAALKISAVLKAGRDVVFLCEGDPFFFGSFAYLHERIAGEFPTIVVPGITAMNAASSLLGSPLAMLKENLLVLSGRHDDAQIRDGLKNADSIVFMKPGSRRQQLLALIEEAGRTEDGCYIEYAGQPGQRIVENLCDLEPGPGPYFSMILLHRQRKTRYRATEGCGVPHPRHRERQYALYC